MLHRKRETKEKIRNLRFLKRVYRVTVKQKNRTFGHWVNEIAIFNLLEEFEGRK